MSAVRTVVFATIAWLVLGVVLVLAVAEWLLNGCAEAAAIAEEGE